MQTKPAEMEILVTHAMFYCCDEFGRLIENFKQKLLAMILKKFDSLKN